MDGAVDRARVVRKLPDVKGLLVLVRAAGPVHPAEAPGVLKGLPAVEESSTIVNRARIVIDANDLVA